MSDSSAAGISALTGSFLGLAVLVVGLRFALRTKTKTPYLIDDWLMLVALISFIGLATSIFLLVDIKVIGYSSFQFSAAEKVARYDKGVKVQTTLVATTVACLACTKASALFFYRRVFSVGKRGRNFFDIAVIASLVIVGCWFLTFLFLSIFQCGGRFSGLWDRKVYAEHCKVSWQFLYGFSVSDVILDVLILALPIPSILRLHTTVARKLSVLGIFMFGCVALGASLARMIIYLRVYILGVVAYDKLDSERILTQIIFYYVLECGVSIVALNLPSIWPIFRGRGLESIMKMARSVTSLTSRKSDESTLRGSAVDQSRTHGAGSLHQGEKAESSLVTQDSSEPGNSVSSKLEITRRDSVNISSEVRKPDSTHRREDAWSA